MFFKLTQNAFNVKFDNSKSLMPNEFQCKSLGRYITFQGRNILIMLVILENNNILGGF